MGKNVIHRNTFVLRKTKPCAAASLALTKECRQVIRRLLLHEFIFELSIENVHLQEVFSVRQDVTLI